SLEEGSLGATIEMRSAHPFDFAGFKFIANMKEDYNTLASSTQPRASMLISDTWDDGHWGALLSVSYSKRNFLDTGASTVRWDEGLVLNTGTNKSGFGSVLGTNCQVVPQPAVCTTTDSALHPRFPRYDYYTDTQTRMGIGGSLQWKPDDNNLFTLDYLHS